MTIKPFNQEELAAWIDKELGGVDGYVLKPGETTAPAYYEYCKAKDAKVTKRICTARLERLTERGKMTRRKELIGGRRIYVYSKVD